MKLIRMFFLLLFLFYLASCKKENAVLTQDSFVKTIVSDSDVAAAGIVKLDDGNFLIAGYHEISPNIVPPNPGTIVKMNDNGKILWVKRLSALNRTLFKVIAVPGTGFATLGIDDYNQTFLYICLYNNEGDTLLTHKVSSGGYNNWMAPYDFIRLSNGNYVVAGGNEFSPTVGYLKILDANFSTLFSRTFNHLSNYHRVSFHGMCETTDSSIALTASTDNHSPFSDTINNLTIFIRADLKGVQKSYQLLYDSLNDETANAVAQYNNGLFAVTSRMPNRQTGGNGTFVNYANNFNGFGLLISGVINIDRFTLDGQLTERKTISDYPLNGMMNSLRATTDGGFILCGTVGQANSPVAVSSTKIYLLKLDADLNEQWSRIVGTTYQAFGVDVIQTSDGGFLVAGYQRSFNKRYEMITIKTDASGNF